MQICMMLKSGVSKSYLYQIHSCMNVYNINILVRLNAVLNVITRIITLLNVRVALKKTKKKNIKLIHFFKTGFFNTTIT